MRLKNYTDINSDLIRAIIHAVCPPGVSGFDVRVSNFGTKHEKGFRGRAHYAGSAYHDRACPFIVVSVARTDAGCRMRTVGEKGKGYLGGHAIGGRLEALVWILAHELRHLWQARVPRGRRVWGARGQFSERDADAYALQMLRRFRREVITADAKTIERTAR